MLQQSYKFLLMMQNKIFNIKNIEKPLSIYKVFWEVPNINCIIKIENNEIFVD